MFDDRSLPVLNSQFKKPPIQSQSNGYATDKRSIPAATSMSALIDDALSTPKHHTTAIAGISKNKSEANEREELFPALDIENLFPNDFGPGSGADDEFQLPKLSPDDEDVGSLFHGIGTTTTDDNEDSHEVVQQSKAAPRQEQENASAFQSVHPDAHQIQNQTSREQNARLTQPQNEPSEMCQCNGRLQEGNINSERMPVTKSPVTGNTPSEHYLPEGTDTSPNLGRDSVFKVPKVPLRRKKRRPIVAVNSTGPQNHSRVDLPATSAMLSIQGSSALGTFSNILPPPPPDNFFESIIPETDETSLDVVLGIKPETENENRGSELGRRRQSSSILPSPYRGPGSDPRVPPSFSPIDEEASRLPNYGRPGMQLDVGQQNQNYESAFANKLPSRLENRAPGLQQRSPSGFSQRRHRPPEHFSQSPNYFQPFDHVSRNSNNSNCLYTPSPGEGAPSNPNEAMRHALKRNLFSPGNQVQKFRKIHSEGDSRATEEENEKGFLASGSQVRFAHVELPLRRAYNAPEQGAESEVNNRLRKKKRTRVEDLDPSEVHVCSFEDCRKKFAKKYNLKIHERRHRGDLPFICPQCAKKFMWQSSFERHLRVHEARADGSAKRAREGKETQNSGRHEQQSSFAVLRTSDSTSQMRLNGLQTIVNRDDPVSLALAMSLCVLNGIPEAELRRVFHDGDAKMKTTEIEPQEEDEDEEAVVDVDAMTDEGQAKAESADEDLMTDAMVIEGDALEDNCGILEDDIPEDVLMVSTDPSELE